MSSYRQPERRSKAKAKAQNKRVGAGAPILFLFQKSSVHHREERVINVLTYNNIMLRHINQNNLHMSILFRTFVIEKISNNNQNRSGMKDEKNWRVEVYNVEMATVVITEWFDEFQEACNYAEREQRDDLTYGDENCYQYNIQYVSAEK